jgi:type IV pilus assembly protein PilE
MKRETGFTLIELMIAVVVVGVLTAIALPSYQQYVLRGKIPEATSKLGELRMKMEQWYADNRTYVGGPCDPGGGRYFTYSCTTQTLNTYTLQAVGVPAKGLSNFTYTLNHANIKASTTPWGNSATCWISRKGESC